MANKLFVSNEAMNFNKYLALINGKRYDYEGVLEQEFEPIGDHILMAYDNSGTRSNLNYTDDRGELVSIRTFYSRIIQTNTMSVFNFENLRNENYVISVDDLVIIIPGLLVSYEEKNRGYYIEILYIAEENKRWYINRNVYREFLNKIKRISGSKINNFNFIKSEEINGSLRIPICINKNMNFLQNIEFTNNIYTFVNNYNNFEFDSLSNYMADIFLGEISFDYFFSHQSRDKDIVSRRIDELREENPFLLIWFDKDIYREEWKKLRGDANQFRYTMQHGILKSKLVIILLSRNYIDKIIGNSIFTSQGQNFTYLGVNYELAVILKEQSKTIILLESSNPYVALTNSHNRSKKLFVHDKMSNDYIDITLDNVLRLLDNKELFTNGNYIEFNTVSQVQL